MPGEDCLLHFPWWKIHLGDVVTNIPIYARLGCSEYPNSWLEVYQTHLEYRMLMVEGNLVVTYMMMLLAMYLRLPGQMMLKEAEICFIIVFFNLLIKILI